MGEVQCDILSGDDMCCLFVRYVDTTNEKITSFKTPDRFDGTLREKVTHILFYRGILPSFPSELSEMFPNLKYIDIYDCGLKAIYAEDLKDFKNLERLKLDCNEIQFLPGNLFEFVPKVNQFSFSNNKISQIGPNLFDFLDELVAANFNGNTTINYNFRKRISGTLEELKKIVEEDCKLIKSLQELAVKGVEKSINFGNYKDILIIAKHLKIENLRKNVDRFLNICE